MKKRHRITCSGFFVLSRIGHLEKIYEKIKQRMAEQTLERVRKQFSDMLWLWYTCAVGQKGRTTPFDS